MQDAANLLLQADSILVFTHINPDGDALGSACALALGLLALGKNCRVYMEHIPQKLAFLATQDIFVDKIPQEGYDLWTAVDCADQDRLGKPGKVFATKPNTLNIDHHLTNSRYAKVNWVSGYSATGQMILRLLGEMGADISRDTAEYLYAAVATDTGNFAYANTDGEVLRDAAVLADCGARIHYLNENIYLKRRESETRLLGKAIGSMSLHAQKRIALLQITLEDLKECAATDQDTEGIIDYGRNIDSVEIALFLREKEEGGIKASLRSKETADVSRLALGFGGGGHVRAAGCSMDCSLEEGAQALLVAAKEELKRVGVL